MVNPLYSITSLRLNQQLGAYSDSNCVPPNGNPVDSTEVDNTMEAIKNKCGKDNGKRKHSLAMTKEFMEKMFHWSDTVCLPSSYQVPSTTVEEQVLKTKHLMFKVFASTAWTVWSRLEDPQALNTPYFELYLTNRKDGRYKICSQADLPACDSYNWLPKWQEYLQTEIYQRPLQPDDYIFPAIGANGIVQTGEHISHEDVNKWIKEFADGAKFMFAAAGVILTALLSAASMSAASEMIRPLGEIIKVVE
ncbi:hypothetical protein C8J57DRAFT_1478171 [Mycena rebaudengoi]|nr:hypothetical protein C8J57DRAFT_1478171 [Mycena rebaudengoi]